MDGTLLAQARNLVPEQTLTLVGFTTAAAITALLAGVLSWFRRLYQLEHHRWWAWTALLATGHHLTAALSLTLGPTVAEDDPVRLTLYALSQATAFIGAVTVVAGTLAFTGRTIDPRKLSAAAVLATALALGCVLTPIHRVAGPLNGFYFCLAVRGAVVGSAVGWCGLEIWRRSAPPPGGWSPTRVLALCFLAIAVVQLHHLIYSGGRLAGIDPGYPVAYLVLLNVVFVTAIAVALVAVALEDERTRTLASASQVREAEAALHRQDRRFRSLIEQSSDILTVLDEDGTIRYESPSITAVLGYQVDECLGTSAFDYLHPDDLAAARQAFERGLGSREPVSHRFRRRHQNGTWVLLEANGRRIEPAEPGERPVVVINSRDVTEREQLHRQLLDAQKLESVGRLAGGVAHDFNNLLTVIKGNTELALARLPAGSAAREEIEDIREAAQRAAQLTRQLLTFARRQIVTPRVIDVNEVVRRTDRLIRPLLGPRVTLTTRLLDLGAFARVDPVQLEQVILNLAVNARDAMPDGGDLAIKVGRCRLDWPNVVQDLAAGSYLTIAVSDTGIGVPEEIRPHLFEPFFTTKPAGSGTGLGLATSYGIVRQCGGAIEVESEPGRGSWFTVLLPEVVPVGTETAEPRPEPRIRGEETILLVEDDPAVRRLAASCLSGLGYRVLEAADGAEGAETFRAAAGTIHLLVTDVVMPRIGGVELARTLRALQDDLPIIFTTGYAEALQDGRDSHTALLLKPYLPLELAAEVRRILDLRPALESTGAAG
jgi:hypothetical protein